MKKGKSVDNASTCSLVSLKKSTFTPGWLVGPCGQPASASAPQTPGASTLSLGDKGGDEKGNNKKKKNNQKWKKETRERRRERDKRKSRNLRPQDHYFFKTTKRCAR